MRDFIVKAIRYCFVGGVASVVDYATYYILTTYILGTEATWHLLIGTAAGFILGLLVNYLLSLLVVWRVSKSDKTGKTVRDIVIFVVVGIVGLIISSGVVTLANCLTIDYRISKLLAMAISLIWNFLARHFLIFNKTEGDTNG